MKKFKVIIPAIIAGILLIATFSCKKEVLKVIPILSTSAASNVTSTTAIAGGTISSDGNSVISDRGFCWSTNQSPTTSDNLTSDGYGTGSYTSSITGLSPGITYYGRAFATNSIGTAYGNQITFTTIAILATLTTTVATSIKLTTATSGGNITNDGGASVTARGVCWGTSQNPSITDSKTVDGTGMSNFTSNITGLNPNTTYYLRAYATNAVGTAYGSEVTIKTQFGVVTDNDGNTYLTVKIDNQVWMGENLKTTKYSNGNLIGTTIPSTLNTSAETTPKYQWSYDGNESNVATYGRLYTWYAATDSRGICPTGWHLPSDAEWTTLATFLGGESVAGGKLKESGNFHWNSPNSGATNLSGFTALPGGYRFPNGTFSDIGDFGQWWSSTEGDMNGTLGRRMYYYDRSVYRSNYYKTCGFSVRCIKDL